MLLAVTAPQISATGSVVTAVVAIVTGAVAIASFRGVRQDSRDRSRPLVLAELRPRMLVIGSTELVIRNAGASVARNITLTMSPPIDVPDEVDQFGTKSLANIIKERYSKPIAALAPGTELINIYSQVIQGQGHVEDVAMEFTVTIEYKNDHDETYVESYPLSVTMLEMTTMATPGNSDERGIRKRWVSALETIARGVGKL